jgi:hypothetical protein
MNAGHVANPQLAHAGDVPPHEVTEAFRYPQHLEATIDRLDDNRGDDGIDAGRGSASDNDCQRS